MNVCLFSCSKLDASVDLKPVSTQEQMSTYNVGEEITCFVSKVSQIVIVRVDIYLALLHILRKRMQICSIRYFKLFIVFCFCLQFHSDTKCLEVTCGPSVTGTVEFLAMIKNPQVR